MKSIKNYQKALLIAFPLALSACDDDDTREVIVEVEVPAPEVVPVDVSYDVTVTNLTNGQPVSPPAVVLHTEGTLWALGDVATVSLERIAEVGDSAEFLTQGAVSAGGSGPITPGDSQTISITIQDITNAKMTIAAMLGNTNDAFSGLSAWDLSQLEVGDSWTTNSPAYDAGTEKNTETAETVPGPAGNGEGFNPTRDDTGFISMHPGVVSVDDGLTNSTLTVEHKFDNPVIRIQVTRTE
ncbi:spondin domain-containing protein [Paraglaciecola sp. 20A4]|uniref:spondin domain-containing protein n=1 Tax=Paraglaciecola sp. 20A4 TaxID=2687288 RepID=UPI00198093E1|nr:spondin domain-containing protein [Paraglaciecola sp. 20A4]